MANISIPGGHGSSLVFNVTGTGLIDSLHNISSLLTDAFAAGTLTINDLTAGTTTTNSAHANSVHVQDASSGTTLNTISSGGNPLSPSAPNVYSLPTGAEYTYVDVGSPTTVFGSTAGMDTVFGGAALTFSESTGGGANSVIFTNGDNTYIGTAGAGGDTVTTGDGHDSVFTGALATTVYGAGTGAATIVLNDTVAVGDQVYISAGTDIVDANGGSDAIYASAPGQSIYGASSNVAGAQLGVFIGNTGTVTGPANDLVVGGAATTSVFDSVGGNTIFGGTGALFFVGGSAGATISDTLESGSGGIVAFGASGNDDNFGSQASGLVVAVAGGGNETLSGANGLGTFVFFGKSDSANAATYNTSVVGGTGTNFFTTGSGTESLTGGTGTNLFTLDEGGAGTNITISDFSAGQDSIAFGNSADSISLNTAVVSNGNLTLTLADNTTVTFLGVTSLTGHTIT